VIEDDVSLLMSSFPSSIPLELLEKEDLASSSVVIVGYRLSRFPLKQTERERESKYKRKEKREKNDGIVKTAHSPPLHILIGVKISNTDKDISASIGFLSPFTSELNR
jgi:hypothetical protein